MNAPSRQSSAPPSANDDEQLARLDDDARRWLVETLADAPLLGSRTRFRVAYARAARRIATPAGTALGGRTADLALATWARGLLLRSALANTPSEEHVELVAELYRTGEQQEQSSVLVALSQLPRPERFVTIAIEACRTNSLLVFGALAQDNPYPAAYFPELHFNQLVLKTIFVGLSVARIVGLAERAGAELARMVREYESERRAAGRAIPADVDYVLALFER